MVNDWVETRLRRTRQLLHRSGLTRLIRAAPQYQDAQPHSRHHRRPTQPTLTSTGNPDTPSRALAARSIPAQARTCIPAGVRRRARRRYAQAAAPQRRQVAVLFVDISGFTRLVETVAPETVYQVVRPLMNRLVVLVRHHHGDIQQVLGDGFMAIFGLTTTGGDEVQQAARAGLAMLAATATGHSAVHLGMEYGEVLVTRSWETAEFGVWGHPVNVAQRLCDLAAPGELHIGPAAFATAGNQLGPAIPVRVPIKGITGSVEAHRMVLDKPRSTLDPVTNGANSCGDR